jgi:hypothetical protein
MRELFEIKFYCNKNLCALKTSRFFIKSQDNIKGDMREYLIQSNLIISRINGLHLLLKAIKRHFGKPKWIYGNMSSPIGYEF